MELDMNCNECLSYKEFKILYEIALIMMDKLELEQKAQESLKKLKFELDLQRCAIYLLNGSTLSISSSLDLTDRQKKMGNYKLGEGATGLAGKSKEPVVIENIHNSIKFLNKAGSKGTDTISYVAVPMLYQKELVGVLGAYLNRESKLSFEQTIEVLTVVSSLIAQSIIISKQLQEERETLKAQKEYYKEQVVPKDNFQNIIGSSKPMRDVFDIIERVANSKATVLIRGESGTGKELIASAIHNLSDRADGPFIKLNCAAITETLLESELFGHEKGAFTDAKATRKGRFELADGGTLFLDEIGDISPNLQVKLLRVLQEQEFERVGGSSTIRVNVRLVAATNRNLEEMIESGKFREDLFYRLNVIPIFLPPLRNRVGDLDILVCHFLEKFSRVHKKNTKFTKEAMEKLCLYSWPGNIRELENTIERVVLMSQSNIVDEDEILKFLPSIVLESRPKAISSSDSILTQKDMEELERDSIVKALKQTKGVQKEASKVLGITTRQLGYKIKKYSIEV